eukprot:scaffold34597_cov43-Attheya_sp.AAC.2
MRSMRLLLFAIVGVSTVCQDGAEAWSSMTMTARRPLFTCTMSSTTTPRRRQPCVVVLAHNAAASTTEDQHDDNDDDDDDEQDDDHNNRSTAYEPPKFSPSFLKRMEQVRASWPTTPENDGGVECTGEPAMDPSRQIQTLDLEDSDWMDW